jgi:serine/threonine protein kinase, bacterial
MPPTWASAIGYYMESIERQGKVEIVWDINIYALSVRIGIFLTSSSPNFIYFNLSMIGQLLAGHYRILQVLGEGGFGQTYITEDLHLPGNPKCVLKHLKPASVDPGVLGIARKLFEKEAIVLQQLGNHDRIPRLLAYFEEDQEFYLVQEYVPGHPLSKELTPGTKWSERQVTELFQEVLDILVFIHGQGVIHRDIKPDNIMRRDSDRRLVLIDFGAIKQVRNQQVAHGQHTMTVAIGTPGYMPIEQASGNPRASSDIYSLGMLGIQALTGVNPYELAEDDRTGELKWEHLTVANPQLVAIIQRMTRYHFRDRYLTAAEALQAVNALVSGVAPPSVETYVQQTTQPQPGGGDSQATVVVGRSNVPIAPTELPDRRTAPKPPARGLGIFPIVAGLGAISAAVGSFIWFSTNILNKRSFADAVKTDLCRTATPTDLSTTRVRSQPQRDAKIQANLPRGTKVVFLAQQDAFVQIQMADNSTGWVFNNQISSCNAAPATPKPTPSKAVESPVPVPVPTPKVSRSPAITPPTPTPTPSPVDSPSPVPIEVPSPIDSPTPTPSQSATPTPSPSLTPYTSPRGIQSPSSSPTPTNIEPPDKITTPKPSQSPTEDKTPIW